MTTRDVTSASRNLLIIYWVVSAFCSYQLGIALRVTTKLVGFATFFLGFMSLMIIPILMASSLMLYIFPKHTPHIWRKIRIPTILIWVSVFLILWLMDDNDEHFHPVTSRIGRIFGSDSDTIYTILFCVFFLTGVISYLTIFAISMKTRFRAVSGNRLSPPELQVSQQSSPQDKRIPGILLWIGLSIIVPLFLRIFLPLSPGSESREIILVPTFLFLLLLSFVFLTYPNNQPILSHAKAPFIGFWFMGMLAMTAWQSPIVIPPHSSTDAFPADNKAVINWNNSVVAFYSLSALGFWGWLFQRGRHLRQDQTSPK